MADDMHGLGSMHKRHLEHYKVLILTSLLLRTYLVGFWDTKHGHVHLPASDP